MLHENKISGQLLKDKSIDKRDHTQSFEVIYDKWSKILPF
jgi:hypothetical protein